MPTYSINRAYFVTIPNNPLFTPAEAITAWRNSNVPEAGHLDASCAKALLTPDDADLNRLGERALANIRDELVTLSGGTRTLNPATGGYRPGPTGHGGSTYILDGGSNPVVNTITINKLSVNVHLHVALDIITV